MLDMFTKGAKWQRINAWISVKDRVPENQDIVLVRTDTDSFSTAYFHGKKGGFIIYGEDAYIKFGEITHWMVIPNIN
jgi:hypothetical protein